MIKVCQFLVFNSILPLSDVGTDVATFVDLLVSGHFLWATLTFFFMWTPFIIHALVVPVNIIKAQLINWSYDEDFEEEYDWKKALRKLVIHLPFVIPFKNVKNAIRLYQLKFGMSGFDDKHWREVEAIQHRAGMVGMYESFTESGPQAIVQLVIILSTGEASLTQKISIPISIFSLAWASSRAFFIQRSADDTDPDPNFKTVFLNVLPWNILIVVNSIVLWSMIGDMIKKHFILGAFICFLTVFWSNKVLEKRG